MNKPLFLLFSFFIFCHAVGQTTFYISSAGNDNNTGLAPGAPWKTLKEILPGNTYLFKRNDSFYFQIQRVENSSPEKRITIASYGLGKKPLLDLYTDVSRQQWLSHEKHTWKIDLRKKNAFSGFLSFNSNIGFLNVNGVIFGNKVRSLNALAQDWDFFTDENFLYVYSTTSPANFTVKFSSNVDAIEPSDNMTIKDLKIIGSGGHGIAGANCSNVVLTGIELSEIGGAYLPGFGDGSVRYGNGIQFWNGSQNCLVTNCSVSNVYDVAFTLQGIGAGVHFSNMHFVNNCADRNEQSFEAWAREGATGFDNCTFRNNRCSNAGYGWSHDVRPDKSQAVHILTYTWDVKNNDLALENNNFYRAKSGLYYHNTDQQLPRFTSGKNHVFLDPHTPIRSLFPEYRIENAEDFVQAVGKEADSHFESTPSKSLPVTLQSLEISKTAGEGVTLQWKLSKGVSESKTEVERSYNRKAFSGISSFFPKGDIFNGDEYSFSDHPLRDSNVFYRLKQTDLDGHVTYTSAITLKQQGRKQVKFNVHPNPCSTALTIDVSAGEAGTGNLVCYDLSGRKQIEQNLSLSAGHNTKQLDIASLPKGIYLLQYSGGGTQSARLAFFKN